MSTLTSPPLFTVKHGGREVGYVDESIFLARRDDGPPVLLLAGRAWRVSHLDWNRRQAHVEPAEDAGKSRWRGEGQFVSRKLCESIRRVLGSDDVSSNWSRRARSQIEQARAEFPWLCEDDSNVLASSGDRLAWWTFAGGRANAALAADLSQSLSARVAADNFAVRFETGSASELIAGQIERLTSADSTSIVAPVSEAAIEGLKFSECLPIGLATEVVRCRVSDVEAVMNALKRGTRVVAEA